MDESLDALDGVLVQAFGVARRQECLWILFDSALAGRCHVSFSLEALEIVGWHEKDVFATQGSAPDIVRLEASIRQAPCVEEVSTPPFV
jgi:hypothetical protein